MPMQGIPGLELGQQQEQGLGKEVSRSKLATALLSARVSPLMLRAT